MKKIAPFLLAVLILILTSCTSAQQTNAGDSEVDIARLILDKRGINPAFSGTDNASTELEQTGPIGPVKKSYADIQAEYPDKTILTVWGIVPSDYITDTLNEYLVRNNAEYVVYFKERTDADLPLVQPPADKEQKDAKRRRINELTDTVDILALERNSFYEISQEGLLEPWKDYLSTEEGKKLYQILPEHNWNSAAVDGQIYGINGRSDYVYGPPSYIVNKYIMLKYGLSEADLNKPIYELQDIIAKVADGEKGNPNFKAITLDAVDFINIQGVNYSYTGSLAIALNNDPSKEAEITLEDPEYLRWLRALSGYAANGYIGPVSSPLENFFLKISFSSGLPYTNPDNGYYYGNDGELADTSDLAEIILDHYYPGSLSWNQYGFYANCIPTTSANKAAAFDFLNKVYTDTYLTNLLLYGIENRNYKLKGGKVDWPIVRINDNCIGNSYLSLPRYFEYPDKKEKYLKLQESLTYPYADFYFNPADIENELQKTNEIIKQLSAEILSGKITDFDALIEDKRKELDAAGIQTLMAEVNRQRQDLINKRNQ